MGRDFTEAAAYAVDSREPCGPLSEELWNQSWAVLSGLLQGLQVIGGGEQRFLAEVPCGRMSDEDFGAAVQLATASPAWVDPSFFRCAIEREAPHEGFVLWSLLSVVAPMPEARSWVPSDITFTDERTLRRLRSFE